MPEDLSDKGKLWAMGFVDHVGFVLKPCCPLMTKHMHREEVRMYKIKPEKKSRKKRKV